MESFWLFSSDWLSSESQISLTKWPRRVFMSLKYSFLSTRFLIFQRKISLQLDDWFRTGFYYKIENSSQEHIDKKEEEENNADNNADENQPINSSNWTKTSHLEPHSRTLHPALPRTESFLHLWIKDIEILSVLYVWAEFMYF